MSDVAQIPAAASVGNESNAAAQSGKPKGRSIEEMALHRVPPLRRDLVFRKQYFVGDQYYVIKDPLRLQYFRLLPEEALMAKWLTEKTTVGELLAKFQRHYPHIECSIADIVSFIEKLSRAGLLNEDPEKILGRMESKERMKTSFIGRWAQSSGSMLFIKLPLVTPGAWLDRLVQMITFVWRPWFWGIALTFMVFTVGRLLVHGDAFETNIYDFFSPGNVFLIWLSVILTKTLHEFGHAATCKYFKGHVPEMGVCFICLTPCGYVDASDAWMMPKRSQKIAINIAGIATEFLIATIAANLWLATGPGLLNSLLFNVMLVASVNTVLMNLNPLMKFDGYYVIADLLEIPNLRTKALAYVGAWLKHFFFGTNTPQASRQNRKIFIVYAIVAFAYMLFITIGLSMIFLQFLDPVGLANLGVVLGVFIFISLLCLPVAKSMMEVTMMTKATKDVAPWRRFALSLGIVSVVLAGAWFFPVHHKVSVQGAFVPRTSEEIRAGTDGWIKSVEVAANQEVAEGQLLIQLENEALEAGYVQAKADMEIAELKRNQASLRGVGADGDYHLDSLETSRMEVLQSQLDRLELQVDRLTITAPRDGVVRELPGSPLNRVEGSAARQGARLLAVDDHGALEIVAGIKEEDLARIEQGGAVKAKLYAGLQRLTGTVEMLPVRPARASELEQAMFASNGGVLPAAAGAEPEEILKRFPLYLVRIQIEETDIELLPGMRVNLDIKGNETTFGRRFFEDAKRYLRDRSGGIL